MLIPAEAAVLTVIRKVSAALTLITKFLNRFTGMQVTVPYLRSEYGKEYDFDAPVKLLDAMMHEQAQEKGQQVVVLGQVLAADVNIGYEDVVNTRVSPLA